MAKFINKLISFLLVFVLFFSAGFSNYINTFAFPDQMIINDEKFFIESNINQNEDNDESSNIDKEEIDFENENKEELEDDKNKSLKEQNEENKGTSIEKEELAIKEDITDNITEKKEKETKDIISDIKAEEEIEKIENEQIQESYNLFTTTNELIQNEFIEISTVSDLFHINNDLNGNYKLVSDIDLEDLEWIPIGTSLVPFSGTLNGNGYRIKNLEIGKSKTYSKEAGLFAYTKNATLLNIILENVNINSITYTGSLAANVVNTLIKNCAVIGKSKIIVNKTLSSNPVGGLVGTATDKTIIENSFTEIDIRSKNPTGGLVGSFRGSLIKNSFSTANVYSENSKVGGLVGDLNSPLENCYFAGNLSFEPLNYQIVGQGDSFVSNSYFNLSYAKYDKFLNNTQAKTTNELMDLNTFENWDFNKTWYFSNDYKYPLLRDINIILEIKEGTKENPKKINTVEELLEINENVGFYYELTSNIDLHGIDWEPIGTLLEPFTGVFDGKDYTIKNLSIQKGKYQNDKTGLFAYANLAEFKNIILENVDILSYSPTGALVGEMLNTKIYNCAVIGDGKIKKTPFDQYMYPYGGLVGYARKGSIIENSFTSIELELHYPAGGIVGRFEGEYIKNSFSSSNIISLTKGKAGGLVGELKAPLINSYYFGKLTNSPYNLKLVGIGEEFVVNSYFDISKAYNDVYENESFARTAYDLSKQEKFIDWDFDDVWTFNNNFQYPTLKSLSFVPETDNLTEGTIKNPKKIYTAEDLIKINDNLGFYYELANDIDLEGIDFLPIASSKSPFTGGLDGKGYKIKNLEIGQIKQTTNYAGLFSSISDSFISNLIIENAIITSKSTVGTLAAYSKNSLITNVAVFGGFIKNVSTTSNYTGGLVGNAQSKTNINNCFTNIEIESMSNYYSGALAGAFSGENIKNSFSTSKITSGIKYKASLVGNLSAPLENCYFAGELIGDKQTYKLVDIGDTFIKNSYFDKSFVPSDELELGDGAKTPSELSNQQTFDGWDFNTIWTFNENYPYPILRNILILPDGTALSNGFDKIFNFDFETITNGILLKWDNIANSNIFYYSIEQKEGENGFFKEVGKSTILPNLELKNLKNNIEYTFRIVAIDYKGNKIAFSDEIKYKINFENNDIYIENFSSKSKYANSNLNIEINATSSKTFINELIIEISKDEQNYTEFYKKTITEQNNTLNIYLDIPTNSLDEGNYFLRAKIKDKENNQSEYSSLIEIVIDTIVPLKPSNLKLETRLNSITLKWAKNIEEDIKFYNVYRYDYISSEFELYKSQITQLEFRDTHVNQGIVYKYRIKAVDEAGNESELSDIATGTPMNDSTIPIVYDVTPKEGANIGLNTSFNITAFDLFGLEKIVGEYKDNNEWVLIGVIETDKSTLNARLVWNNKNILGGKKELRFFAIDQSGNQSEYFYRNYDLKLMEIEKPSLTVESGGMNTKLTFNYSSNQNIKGYSIYRAIDEDFKKIRYIDKNFNTYVDNNLDPNIEYKYYVEITDFYGNIAASDIISVVPLNIDSYEPKAKIGFDFNTLVNIDTYFDGSRSTDNVGIVSYEWDLGDGSKSFGEKTSHVYNTPGTYKVTLTVKDEAGNQNSQSIKVTVFASDQVGVLKVKVSDKTNGKSLPNASVYVDFPDTPMIYITDSDGIATIVATAGNYNISAYKTKYKPKEENKQIVQYETTQTEIKLDKGDVVKGEIISRRLLEDEIIEEGIDVNDPANKHIFRFDVTLEFGAYKAPKESFIVGSGGFYNGKTTGWKGNGGPIKFGNGGYLIPYVVPNPEHPEIPPVFAVLILPNSISFLKEFFEVAVLFQNLADEQFLVTKGEVELRIPEGLSLAETAEEQNLLYELDDLPGGGIDYKSWFLRGDIEGEYDLSADYNAFLQPFDANINTTFKTTEPLIVNGSKGLKIYVDPEKTGIPGEDYEVEFALVNESTVPLYNVNATFGTALNRLIDEPMSIKDPITGEIKELDNTEKTYLISDIEYMSSVPYFLGGDRVIVDVIYPGQALVSTYKTKAPYPENPDDYDEELILILRKAFSQTKEGSTIEIPVLFEPIPNKYKGRVPNHKGPWDLSMFNGVDATGALIINSTLVDITGINYIPFNVIYNSFFNDPKVLDLNEPSGGMLGNGGFASNYDMKVKPIEDGSISLYFNGNSFVRFTNVNKNKGVSFGKIKDGIIEVSKSSDIGEYRSGTTGFQRYILNKGADGTYQLVDDKLNIYYFNLEGNLIKTSDRKGKVISVNKTPNRLEITEENTNKTLTAELTNNFVTSVSDAFGNKAKLEYNAEDNLSTITDLSGKVTKFEYNPQNRLSKIITGGQDVVSYEYDEFGRVLNEIDAENRVTSYSYDDKSEFWRTIVTRIDRNFNASLTKVNRLGQVVYNKNALNNVTLFTYNKYGDMTSIKDALNNSILYDYDVSGNILSITDHEGITEKMTYDKNNNLIMHELENGSKTINSYNQKNWLIGSVDERGAKATYDYNEDGQMISKTVEDLGTSYYSYNKGRLQSQTDFLGNTINYNYDDAGRLISVEDRNNSKTAFEYDKNGKLIKETDANLNSINYQYDEFGNLTTVLDKKNNQTTYYYDRNNRLIKTIDAKNGETEFGYDGERNLIYAKNPDGGVYTYSYDAINQLKSQTDAENNTTRFEYDPVGRITKSIRPNSSMVLFDYYKNGLLKSQTDAMGNITKYFYNNVNVLSRIEDPEGNLVDFEYDSSGNLLKQIDPLGNIVNNEYDKFNRLIASIDPNGNRTSFEYTKEHQVKTITDALGNNTFMMYDPNGNLKQTTNARGAVTSIEYDNLDNVLSVKNPLGNTSKAEYDANGNITKILDAYDKILQTITYDELDRATKTTNALGYENSVLYNENFEIITKTNALGKNTNYEYNKIGKLVKSIDAEGGVISFTYDEIGNMKTFTDQNGGVTILDYDLAGRLIKETMSTGGVKTYTYNSLNQLTQTINARGQNLDFSYDKNGRLTDYASNKYTYDKNGNVLTVTNEEGTTKRQYDQLNRVTSYEDVFGNIIRYEYDEVGNIIKLKYPTGETVSYSYDLANNLLTVTDYRNRVTSYEYNKNDILIETKLPDGTIEKLSYNELNQMVEKKIIYKTQEKIYKFTYDKVGNIIEEDKPNLSDENAENVLNIIERTMTYTKGNRLETFNGETIIYDADGNMTTGPLKGTMAEYHYDKFDQLLSVSGTNYKYDGSGTRLKQSWSNDTKALSYITDPNSSLSKVLITTETPTNKTKIYVYGLGLISQEDVGESYTNYRIFHYDYRGSTIALTDETGAIKDSFVYGPYGELVQNTGKIETIFLYVGKYGVETDQNSLIYMRARYYDPATSRMLSQDKYWNVNNMIYGDSWNTNNRQISLSSIRQSSNLYVYAMNNPIRYQDPSGLKSEERIGTGIWSLKMDTFGIMIVSHWLYGGGKDLILNGNYPLDDETHYTLGQYMMENKILTSKVKDIVFPMSADLKNGESMNVNMTTSMVIDNGEDIIGYQYLHGTNADVGGFQINGTISKNNKGDITYDLTYTWNDMIDPNFIYESDSKKAEFAKSIPGANPKDYYIQISWSDKTIIKAKPSFWFNWNSGWLSK